MGLFYIKCSICKGPFAWQTSQPQICNNCRTGKFSRIGLYRDGGTGHYIWGDQEYWQDHRLFTVTKNQWYTNYPEKDNKSLITDQNLIYTLNQLKSEYEKNN